MKRFLEIVMPMKTAVCYCYSASVCILMAVAWLFQWEAISLSMLFSMLLACAAAGILQILAFTETVIKRLAYTWRILLFAVPFLAILTAIAMAFHWFPIERRGSWLLFLAIFLVIFLVTSAGFEIYFHIAGKKYDGLLGQYRKNKEHRP